MFPASLTHGLCRLGLWLILSLTISLARSQPPFAGGPGDGYACSTLDLRTTADRQREEAPWRIYPQPIRSGQALVVLRPGTPSGRLTLLDLQGRILHVWVLNTGERKQRWPVLAPGVYVLRWTQGGRQHHQIIKVVP
jgi:hypothetical protein